MLARGLLLGNAVLSRESYNPRILSCSSESFLTKGTDYIFILPHKGGIGVGVLWYFLKNTIHTSYVWVSTGTHSSTHSRNLGWSRNLPFLSYLIPQIRTELSRKLLCVAWSHSNELLHRRVDKDFKNLWVLVVCGMNDSEFVNKASLVVVWFWHKVVILLSNVWLNLSHRLYIQTYHPVFFANFHTEVDSGVESKINDELSFGRS